MLRHLPPRLHETSQSRILVRHPGRQSLVSPPLLLLLEVYCKEGANALYAWKEE